MSKRNTSAKLLPTRAIQFFKPRTVVRRDELDWLKIFKQDDFLAIGLCQRHVQIDDTGRDWFGMPFLIDADCARVQGSPYVAELKGDEKVLNDYLWQLQGLLKGTASMGARIAFHNYLSSYRPGQELLTAEQHFEQYVRLLVDSNYYPSPRAAAAIALEEGRGTPDFDDQGNAIASPYEKFCCMPYWAQVAASLEYMVQWKRQDIYYDRIVQEARREDVRDAAARQAQSQAHWRKVDAEREYARQQYLTTHAGALSVAIPTPAPQLDMFALHVEPAPAPELTHDIDYHDVTSQKQLPAHYDSPTENAA